MVLRCFVAGSVGITHFVPHTGKAVHNAGQSRQHLAEHFVNIFACRIKIEKRLNALVELNQVAVVLRWLWRQLLFNFD